MRILVTGSTDGLGRLTAESLLDDGHQVAVHARNAERAAVLAPLTERGAEAVVADLSQLDEVFALADELREVPFDAVVHNAGVIEGPAVLPVNVVAPYLLTALLPLPRRLVVLSSSMHNGGVANLDGVDWTGARAGSYSDSKLFVTAFAMALARRYPQLAANAVDPGWVPTKMGGQSAPDDLTQGHRTQEWLATSDDPRALSSGGYWHHHKLVQPHASVHDIDFQEALLDSLAEHTGVRLDDRH